MEIWSDLFRDIGRYFLLTARFSGIGFIPVFSMRNVPVRWRAAFVMIVAFLGWQAGFTEHYTVNAFSFAFYTDLFAELILGMSLALVVHFVFAGLQMAGQVMDTQMGFGIVNVIDPITGTSAPLLGNFQYILAMFIFLNLDGHVQILQALQSSYEFIPAGAVDVFRTGSLTWYFINMFGGIFLTGFRLASPIMASLLITDFVLGFITRTVPQLNVFMVSLPIKILLGFVFLFLLIPFYIIVFNQLMNQLFEQVMQAIRVLS